MLKIILLLALYLLIAYIDWKVTSWAGKMANVHRQ